MITTSSAFYYQLKDHLSNIANSESVWSDFKGPGATYADYSNAEDPGKSTIDLNMNYAWKDGATFGADCVEMAGGNSYQLDPVDCAEADKRYVCVKPGKKK